MRFALDSNVLLYAARAWKTEDDEVKANRLDSVLFAVVDNAQIVVPLQALGECYQVMGRYGFARELRREIIRDWVAQFQAVASSEGSFTSAFELATLHKLQFWDALIMNVAAEAGCDLLLSEDLQPGFAWRGLTVANPFADPLDRKLQRAMRG